MARLRRTSVLLAAAMLVSGAEGGAYNETEALVHAYLVTAAYCGYPRSSQAALERWDCGPACDAVPGMTDVRQILTSDHNDAYAFVGKRDGHCIVAFRGTSDLAGWIEDLKATDLVDLTKKGVSCHYRNVSCQVGDGFMANYNSIAKFVKGNLSAIGCPPGKALSVTGHSLGAAEAVIAQFDLKALGYDIVQTYTFGQPRVGDVTFGQAWSRDVGPTLSYRVSYHRDPVVHLPFENFANGDGFQHVATEVFYDGTVAQGKRVCNGCGEDPKCADKYTDVLPMCLECVADISKCDHLNYMTAVKTILMDGSSCTNGTSNGVIV